jgi:pSer/pThr/pTyr-binding forkhead associated (FHA) protein
MPYKLVVNFGGKTVERKEVDAARYVIGRASECDLVIDNLGISRQHAEIVLEAGVPILKDMKSNNGTYVNGKRITRYNLNDGDEISIGKFAITFHMEQPEEPEGEGPPPEEEPAAGGGERKGDFTLAIDSRLMERQREKVSKLKAFLCPPGGDKKKAVILEKSIYCFGKTATCDFQVGGFFAPPKSAFIFRDDVAFHLVDTGKGKALLNDSRIEVERLKDGDVINVGGMKLEFHVGTPNQM